MKKKTFAIKFIIIAILIGIYQFVSPIIEQDISLNQIENTFETSIPTQFCENMRTYFFMIMVVFSILLFRKELKMLVKKIKK